ncbi:MAG: DUF3616 domain-containing protein [Stanieria sp.]
MTESFLLSRILLRFEDQSEDLIGDLSAVAVTPDGSLWLGSDELLGIERVSLVEPNIFAHHQHFPLGDFIELLDQENEIDIEGFDYSDGYLWLTGSHSTKRKKAKGDLQRLTQIKTEANRYLLARIPIINGKPVKSYSPTEDHNQQKRAACLETKEASNILIDALKEDEHFGAIVSSGLPSKDNGLDIEGLAVHQNKIFLGLRGPVLRGWAIILELEIEETEPGILTLKKIEQTDRLYKKHFLDLDGLGVRELCFHGEDLIILAGPTMVLDGAMRVFRWYNALDHSSDSLSEQESGKLEVLFDLPLKIGTDRAEGLALYTCLGQKDSLLVVYDSPDPSRIPQPREIFADVFQLK